MDTDLLKLLGPYGFAGVLTYIIVRIAGRIFSELIGAIKELVSEIKNHTKVDLEHHGEVKEAIVDLRARFDVIQDITPVEVPKRRTSPHGVPVGYYGPRRPTNKDDD